MIRNLIPSTASLLRVKALAIADFSSPKLGALVTDMFETMRAGGGVGLAAPQIGVSLRIIVFEFLGGDRAPAAKPIPATVIINPEVEPTSDDLVEDWEGSLSIPGMRGWVNRWDAISYLGRDLKGESLRGGASGFHARIIQHEVDYLNGILYTDHATNTEPYERAK
jgi:peptide deformylase